MGSSVRCPLGKACPSDFLAVAVTAITCVIICFGLCFLWVKRNTPEVRAKQAALLMVQALGSIMWLVSLLMSKYVSRLETYGQWLTCYLWQVWVESPLGYCLVASCYVTRAYRLYYVFVRRRLPPLKSRHVVLLLLVPSVCTSAIVQWREPFQRKTRPFLYCYGPLSWWLLITGTHALYMCFLIVSTWLVRNIRFEFNESKELLASVIVSVIFLGVWLSLLFESYHHRKQDHFQATFEATTSYIFAFLASAIALCFSFFPLLRPLKAFLGYQSKQKDEGMGHALGVPNSGLLHPHLSFRFDEPLEALLQHKRFRQTFQAFADSRLAGECVKFYVEVRELHRIPFTNAIARIYMAQHIIGTYVANGSSLEINISHAMRSDILNTKDLSNVTLFDFAASEALNIMHMNLEQDFWHSSQFRKLKEEMDSEVEFAEQLEWMNVSSKRDSFSTTDNLFEYNGSPQVAHKHGSPNNEAFALPPSLVLCPENLLRVSNDMKPIMVPSQANLKDAQDNLGHGHNGNWDGSVQTVNHTEH